MNIQTAFHILDDGAHTLAEWLTEVGEQQMIKLAQRQAQVHHCSHSGGRSIEREGLQGHSQTERVYCNDCGTLLETHVK